MAGSNADRLACLAHSSLAYLAPISFPLQISRPLQRGTNAHYQYAEQSQAVHSLSHPSQQRENVEQARDAAFFLGSCSKRLQGTHATSWEIVVLRIELPRRIPLPFLAPLESVGKQNMHQCDRHHLNVTMKSIRCRVTFLFWVFLLFPFSDRDI